MAVAKKRCRTIKGVVFDLEPTDREPPCGRARASKPAPASRKSAAPRKSVALIDALGGPRVSEYDRRRLKRTALPAPIDPAKAERGARVSVFSYAENEPSHGVLIGLPGDKAYIGVDVEPTVLFESGSNAGMKRHIRWERIFPGWLDPNVNWKPWKG